MTIFYLVAEGVTDWDILNAVAPLIADDLDIQRLHPQEVVDNTSRSTDEAGWVGVLRYIESEKFTQVVTNLAEDEYVVVQIDTDVAQETHFGVDLRPVDGVPPTTEVLIERVIANLRGRCLQLDAALLDTRVIFAICVNCIECWLLPYFFAPPTAAKESGCIRKLNEILTGRHNLPGIDPGNKDHEIYYKIAQFARKKRKKYFTDGNVSLDTFLNVARERLRSAAEQGIAAAVASLRS